MYLENHRQEIPMSAYVFGKTVNTDAATTRQHTIDALAQVGFGVLTEIDVQATMKKKIDLDMPPYWILGACNPRFASRAIAAEPAIGALLPCNVVVREDAQGVVHVDVMDPAAVMGLVGNPGLLPIAGEVRGLLEQALATL
jgi:uncharacterized protein (DUF302 family)